MKKTNAKGIIKKVKDREKASETANITFRLPKNLISHFKATCEREGVGPNKVAEELIRDFTNNVKN